MQHNTSYDKLVGCNGSRLWHGLSLLSLCSTTRGNSLIAGAAGTGKEMCSILVRCLGCEYQDLVYQLGKSMHVFKKDTSFWPLKLLFSDRPVHDVLLPTYSFAGRSQRATGVRLRGELLLLLLNSL